MTKEQNHPLKVCVQSPEQATRSKYVQRADTHDHEIEPTDKNAEESNW